MENSKLTFVATYSLNDFKERIANTSTMDVVKNPKTEKLFFVTPTISGAIASDIDYDQPLSVSSVKGDDDVQFYLLHNRNTSNVQRVL